MAGVAWSVGCARIMERRWIWRCAWLGVERERLKFWMRWCYGECFSGRGVLRREGE